MTLLLVTSVIWAGGTRIWETTTAKDFEAGEFKGTLLATNGKVQPGFELQKIKCPEPAIWSYAYDAGGRLYLGTGTKGIIYRFENGQLTELYKTGAILVTSLAMVDHLLYAATIPEGKIFQINTNTGESKLWLKLPSAYIWGLAFEGKSLLAAAGPEAILYRISLESAMPEVLLKTEEKHFLSLALDEQNIYVGSDPNGLLFQIDRSTGKARVLADLAENEIRAIALAHGKIYLAANVTKSFDNAKMAQALAREIEQQGQQSKPINRKELLQKMVSGAVYEFQANVGHRLLMQVPKNFLTTIQPYQKGILCGTGMDGFVYHIAAADQISLLADLRDDQVTSIILQQNELQFLGTGDTGFLYRINPTPREIKYHSPILDATGMSKWGRLQWQKQGDLSIQTRSGNTQTPDSFWSDWADVSGEMRIQSPNARYLQYRVIWTERAGVLESVRIFYHLFNRAPQISGFKIEGNRDEANKLYSSKIEKKWKLSWKTEDEDKDELRFRIYYQNIETSVWYEITGPEILNKPNFTWDTSALPDGYYILQVVVLDESDTTITNKTTYTHRPMLVDNHAPILTSQRQGNEIRLLAQDTFSCISQISYRIPNGEWQVLEPFDGIYDDLQENALVIWPDNANVLEVRAFDSNGNIGYALVK